jgi:hypothetical protein
MSLSFDAPVPRIQCAKESGADAGLMGITCYMIRPTARFMYWHQSTMARPSQMAIRSPQHKCPNEEGGYKGGSARGRRSANGTKQTYETGAKLFAQQRKKNIPLI